MQGWLISQKLALSALWTMTAICRISASSETGLHSSQRAAGNKTSIRHKTQSARVQEGIQAATASTINLQLRSERKRDQVMVCELSPAGSLQFQENMVDATTWPQDDQESANPAAKKQTAHITTETAWLIKAKLVRRRGARSPRALLYA
jgi:hypothetical protein